MANSLYSTDLQWGDNNVKIIIYSYHANIFHFRGTIGAWRVDLHSAVTFNYSRPSVIRTLWSPNQFKPFK